MELNVPQSRPHNYFMHPSTHKLPHIPVLAWQRLRGCHVRRCHTFYFFPLGRYSGNLIAGGESADGPVRGEGGRKGHDALIMLVCTGTERREEVVMRGKAVLSPPSHLSAST